jgi:hypothetical protein
LLLLLAPHCLLAEQAKKNKFHCNLQILAFERFILSILEAVPSVDAIIEGFPQKPEKIQGIPNYYTLNTLRQALYCNTHSFASTLGGGNHGYLGALMSPQTT